MGQFCSGYDTSQKWQLNESGIAIMPMGATEQHGSHLPLNTDTITASYFAEYVAKELHAMLLPPMPFGTSLEHAGFRGTISLKPEVLISFIQNITDELEAQNIRFFIIMNGHGGNFAMSPAVRQINRQDRKIKVLIINCWEFQNHPSKQPEVHAGEGETSLMLAIDKKLVGDLNVPISNPSLQAENFKQSDLNTFGVGRMTPHGIWGCPQHATQEKGKKQIADIKKNIVPFILERIKRLDKDPRYGGPGPIVLRPFHDSDIPFGMFVKNQANWNQLEQDWQMILETNQNGHFIAMQNGLPVGTATTINYSNRFCWVGMVLVDSTKRRSGIGKTLLINAIEQAKKIGTVRLDATPDGKKLYDTLGFKVEYQLSRLQCFAKNFESLQSPIICQPMKINDLTSVLKMDFTIFGAEREIILRNLFRNKPNLAWVCKTKNSIQGYCFGRAGSQFTQIGPLIAKNQETAEALLIGALKTEPNTNFIIDALDDQKNWNKYLKNLGFTVQRPFIRMYLGKHTHVGQTQNQYLIAGPELG
jgi:creatinine amidohydrolase